MVILLAIGLGVVALAMVVGLTLFLNWLLDAIQDRLGTTAGLIAAAALVVGGIGLMVYPLASAMVRS